MAIAMKVTMNVFVAAIVDRVHRSGRAQPSLRSGDFL
jgi:hypothetical protein